MSAAAPDRAETTSARIEAARRALTTAETAVGLQVPAVQVPQEKAWPVPAVLEPVLPGGLRPGSVVEVHGSTTVLMALAQAAAGSERWCALVGMPDMGWAAAAAVLDLNRVVAVPRPQPETATVLAALIDGFDVLVVGRCPGLSPADRRALTSRLRHRHAVLLTDHPWAGSHRELRVRTTGWGGVGRGDGVLRERQLLITGAHRADGGPMCQIRVVADRDGIAPYVPAEPPVAPAVAAPTQRAVVGADRKVGAGARQWAEAG